MKKLATAAGLVLALAVPASATTTRILPTQDAWPVWSPDGARLAFTRIGPAGMTLEVLERSTHKVWALGTSGGQLLPSWSPGPGRQIAYQARGHVRIADADGSRDGNLDLGPGYSPTWHPKGGRLAYLAPRRGHLALTVATPPAHDATVLADEVIGAPAWSPGGFEIAFQRVDGVYVVGLFSTPERQVAVTAGEPGAPVWSPNGTQIAYTAGGRVWIVPSDGSTAATPISRSARVVTAPIWSRDGAQVVFTTERGVEVAGLHRTESTLVRGAGLGAAYAPQGADVAFAGQLTHCPGHIGIRLFHGSVATTLSGTCVVRGTPKADVIEGSLRENDVILAGAGADRVHANDRHTDRVDCGPGRDTVWADRTDRLAHCEIVHR